MNKFALHCLLCVALFFTACGNPQPKRIVSETPVKTDVLGIELCSKVTQKQVDAAIEKATGTSFYVYDDAKYDAMRIFEAWPSYDLNYVFGNTSWHYSRIYLDQNDLVYQIELHESFESVDKAKEKFEAVKAMYTQKYGKSNDNTNEDGEQLSFWTDDTNSVGVYYTEGATKEGQNRSYCILYYVNRELKHAVEKAVQPDI